MDTNLTAFNGRAPEKLAYRISEASVAMGIGKTSIYELINRGELKTIKVAGRRLILKADIEAFLSACRDAT
jgi:excisionase family DNA binding protein